MEFFDKVKKVAIDVAAVSSKQSKKLYSITKIKLEIAEKQNDVKTLYKEIGFDAYRTYKTGGNIVENISAKLEKIDAIEEEIAILRKSVDEIKNTDELGVEDIPTEDDVVQDADVIDADSDFNEDEVDPIDPIE